MVTFESGFRLLRGRAAGSEIFSVIAAWLKEKHLHYEDYIFFRLEDGELVPIPHQRYVELMHRVQPIPEYAKQRLRVALFYVEMDGSRPVAVVNATYNLLYFDEAGFAAPLTGQHSLQDNRAFFEAVRISEFDNIDCDPEIQKLRNKLGEEFSWVPTSKELCWMVHSIFSSWDPTTVKPNEDTAMKGASNA